MVKRVNKVRKSAILEHLLDLERQIRSELARAGVERKAVGRASDRAPQHGESLSAGSDGRIMPGIAQRYLH